VGSGSAGEAVTTVVRSTSPILSVVPEDRSRVGDEQTIDLVCSIPFRRVL